MYVRDYWVSAVSVYSKVLGVYVSICVSESECVCGCWCGMCMYIICGCVYVFQVLIYMNDTCYSLST